MKKRLTIGLIIKRLCVWEDPLVFGVKNRF